MIVHRFSVTDERHIQKMLAGTKQKCQYCRRVVTAPPCQNSDHGWNSLLMALDDAQEPCISTGCSGPTEPQAPCITTGARRHPWTRPTDWPDWKPDRPHNSGWCVDLKCACECHANEPIPTDDLEEL